jgi:hypothetical protein
MIVSSLVIKVFYNYPRLITVQKSLVTIYGFGKVDIPLIFQRQNSAENLCRAHNVIYLYMYYVERRLRIHAVRLQTLLQVEKLIANSMLIRLHGCAGGLDACWLQTHYVCFVMARFI